MTGWVMVGVPHESIEFRAPPFGARDSRVHVFTPLGPAAVFTVLSQLAKLELGILAATYGGNSRVQYNSGRLGFLGS
jgi:hypothetical protein